MPFNIALSGLRAATVDLEVTGHNIANAATTGFKESRAEFADIYANTIYDSGNNSTGKGVLVADVAQMFNQGSIDFTGRNFDLAVSGNGFFITDDAAGNRYYTRAGEFSVDRDGYVINSVNRNLQVFPPIGDPYDTENVSFNVGSTQDLQLPTAIASPNATTEVVFGINLDSTETAPVPAFSTADPTSYNHATSTTVYDSLGQAHTSTYYFRKTGANAWNMYTYVDDGSGTMQQAASGSPTAITFNADGTLATPAGGTFAATATMVNGSTTPLSMTFDISNMTQYGSTFDINYLTQDGYTVGRLTGVDVADSGVVYARFSNGKSEVLGKVALGNFNNPQGLRKAGDTSWQETYDSGAVRIAEPETSDFGSIQGGALETSNTDIAEQLVKLIVAQRNYQANAEVISTADTITQTIINMR